MQLQLCLYIVLLHAAKQLPRTEFCRLIEETQWYEPGV